MKKGKKKTEDKGLTGLGKIKETYHLPTSTEWEAISLTEIP